MSLHQAITSGRLHQTRLLLDIGANVNSCDRQLRTPFMLTAVVEQEKIGLKMAKILLDKGANVERVDLEGRTAMSYACLHGRESIIALLLDETDFDSIINLADKEGNTPLMYVAMSGSTGALRRVLEIIMKYGISVDLRNRKGFSAYLLAAKLGNVQCAHVLKVEGGASDGIRDLEFFLCDKEWVKRGRKEERREHEGQASYGVGGKYGPTQRPRTCPNLSSRSKIVQESNRRDTRRDVHRSNGKILSMKPNFSSTVEAGSLRAASRLTTRSEPVRIRDFRSARNRWLGDVEERSRDTDSQSGRSLVLSDSTRTSSIPAAVRTQSPDLHAIFSHYVRLDTAPIVTCADKPRIEARPKLEQSRESGMKSARERRHGRVSVPKKISLAH